VKNKAFQYRRGELEVMTYKVMYAAQLHFYCKDDANDVCQIQRLDSSAFLLHPQLAWEY
jgi:hypothetical protein